LLYFDEKNKKTNQNKPFQTFFINRRIKAQSKKLYFMNLNEFSTFDLGLATVLVTLDYELLELDRSNPKRIRFIFKQEKNTEKVVSDYFNDKIKLPAQTLFNNQKNLKNRIYSGA
jgi:hypothetical protein